MKNKFYLFLIMFVIWSMVNIIATLFLHWRLERPYFHSFHPVNFYVPLILSGVAVIPARYFYMLIAVIFILTLSCLIPGLIHGNIIGDAGFIPVRNINNSIFVQNELALILTMHWFYERMPLTLAIILSDV